MKCLETESLIRYAYHLTDEPVGSQVREHLAACARCREIVEQYGRLDALLDEWKEAEPSPQFDARVRQAVEAHQATCGRRGWWGWDWARSLALASLGVLIVTGVVWFARSHPPISRVAVRQPRQVSSPPATVQKAEVRTSVTPHAGVKKAHAVPALSSVDASLNEDNDAQALEDYDLAAQFDVLSELPKEEARVAN